MQTDGVFTRGDDGAVRTFVAGQEVAKIVSVSVDVYVNVDAVADGPIATVPQ